MDYHEMSNFLDIVYNNITSNQAPGLNLFEKSHFLTMAQELIVKEIYEGTRSFESTEYSAEALQPLVKQVDYGSSYFIDIAPQIQPQAPFLGMKSFRLARPEDLSPKRDPLMFIVYEEVQGTKSGCTDETSFLVYPTTHNEFYSISNNPFRGTKGNRVLRLLSDNKIELWLPEDLSVRRYELRYIKKPSPILLVSTSPSYTVDGEITAQSCELPEFLHRTIVNRAAALAKAVWQA